MASILTPGQRRLLRVLLGIGVFVLAISAYLLLTTPHEAPGRITQGTYEVSPFGRAGIGAITAPQFAAPERDIPVFYQVMLLEHIFGAGLVITVALAFVVWHLANALRGGRARGPEGAHDAVRGEGREIRVALLTGPSSFPTPCAAGSPEAARRVLDRMERWRALALEAACVHRTLVSRGLVEDLHRRGWAVHVFTVDEEAAVERLDEMGVDGVFSNDPGRLLRRWPPAASVAHR